MLGAGLYASLLQDERESNSEDSQDVGGGGKESEEEGWMEREQGGGGGAQGRGSWPSTAPAISAGEVPVFEQQPKEKKTKAETLASR